MYSSPSRVSPRNSRPSSPNSSSQNASQTDGLSPAESLFIAGVGNKEEPKVKFSLAEVRKQIRILRDSATFDLHEQALSILNEFVKNERQPKDNNGLSDVRSCISNCGDVKLWVTISSNSNLMKSQEYKDLVTSFLVDIARSPKNHMRFVQRGGIYLLISLLDNLPHRVKPIAISNMLQIMRGYSYGWKAIDGTVASDSEGNCSIPVDSLEDEQRLRFNFTTRGHIIAVRTGDDSECSYLEFIEEIGGGDYEGSNERLYEFKTLFLNDTGKQPGEIAQLLDQKISRSEIFAGCDLEKFLPDVALETQEDTIRQLIRLLTDALDNAKILASMLLAHLTSSPENCARVMANNDCFTRLVKLLENESCREHALITLFQLYQYNQRNIENIATATIKRVDTPKALRVFVTLLNDSDTSTNDREIVAKIILNIVSKIKGEGFDVVTDVIAIPALVDMLNECDKFITMGELSVRTLVYFAEKHDHDREQLLQAWPLDRWIRLLVNSDIPLVIKSEAAKIPAGMYAQQLSNLLLCDHSDTFTAQLGISQEDALNALSQLSNSVHNCACLHELISIFQLVHILHSDNSDAYKSYASNMLTNLIKTSTLAILNPVEGLPLVDDLETAEPLVNIGNKVVALVDWVDFLDKRQQHVLRETAIVALGILVKDAECQQTLVYHGVIRLLVLCMEDSTTLMRSKVLLVLRQLAITSDNLIAFANAEVGVVLSAFLEISCNTQLCDSVKELFRRLSDIIRYDGLDTQYAGFGGCADDLFNNEYKVAAAMELMMWMSMAGKLYRQGEGSPVFSEISKKYNDYVETGNLIAWGKVVCRLTARLTGVGRDRERMAEAIALLSRHPRIQFVMKQNGIVQHLVAVFKHVNSSAKIKECIGEAIRNIGGYKKYLKDTAIVTSLYNNDGSHKGKPYNNQNTESSIGVPAYKVIASPNPPDSEEENPDIVFSAPTDGYYQGSHDGSTRTFHNKKPEVGSVAIVDKPKERKKSSPIAINSDNVRVAYPAGVGDISNDQYPTNRNFGRVIRGANNGRFMQEYRKKMSVPRSFDEKGRLVYNNNK